MTNSRVSRFTSLLVAWCACGGGAKPPMYQLTHSEASIRGAEEVGAPDVPTAALHLKLARDQLIAAKQLIAERVDYDKAKLLLRRAEAVRGCGAPLAHPDPEVGCRPTAAQDAGSRVSSGW